MKRIFREKAAHSGFQGLLLLAPHTDDGLCGESAYARPSFQPEGGRTTERTLRTGFLYGPASHHRCRSFYSEGHLPTSAKSRRKTRDVAQTIFHRLANPEKGAPRPKADGGYDKLPEPWGLGKVADDNERPTLFSDLAFTCARVNRNRKLAIAPDHRYSDAGNDSRPGRANSYEQNTNRRRPCAAKEKQTEGTKP